LTSILDDVGVSSFQIKKMGELMVTVFDWSAVAYITTLAEFQMPRATHPFDKLRASFRDSPQDAVPTLCGAARRTDLPPVSCYAAQNFQFPQD